MAYVDLHNNTGVAISVDIHGKKSEIAPKQNKRLMFGGQFLIVNSSIGQWKYDRKIIPYGGEDGPYFDGTIHVQLNKDGLIYALKKSESPPLSNFNEQPKGFPIEPSS